MTNDQIPLSDADLREILALFSSPSKYEHAQTYQPGSGHFYEDEDLSSEYTLTQEKGEFAIDAWRAVISFLHRRKYSLWREGVQYDTSFIEDLFVG